MRAILTKAMLMTMLVTILMTVMLIEIYGLMGIVKRKLFHVSSCKTQGRFYACFIAFKKPKMTESVRFYLNHLLVMKLIITTPGSGNISYHKKLTTLNMGYSYIGDHGFQLLHCYICGNMQEITTLVNNLTGASSSLIGDCIVYLQPHTLL